MIDEIALGAMGGVEGYLRRRLITQKVRLTRDGFGPGGIALPIDPVQSVDAVRYVDTAGTMVTMPSAGYRLIRSGVPTELHPAYGTSWPSARADRDAVEIDLVVGYGATPADVPAPIRDAVRQLVAQRYLHPEPVSLGAAVEELPMGLRDMLAPFRFWP